MTNITVYDTEAKTLEEMAERNDMTVASIVEMLIEYADDMKEDNGLR